MKTECWYSDLGDLTGPLHVLRVLFALLPSPSPSSLAALKSRGPIYKRS